MNLQPVVQSRSSANGFSPRRIDGEMGSRTDSKSQMTKSSYGVSNGGDTGGFGSPSRDRLIFVSTCLIGHSVEVHVKNGSVLSGIFHTINAEKDFGIVLKMARTTKDGSVRGAKPVSEAVKRPQTMIIPARELVQVIAKGISLTNEGFSSGSTHEKRQDFMTDSAISQSRRVDVERELERWTPDKDDPQCPELENIFDKHWNRSWNQFETNEALFGVKTTFNEELYTTKLERGPQMRELEREALRIAREIEGEDTKDLHLAEERGIQFDEHFDFDEEARFSSVYRGIGGEMDRENEDITLDDVNSETFGDSFRYGTNQQFLEISQRKNNGAQATSSSSSRDEDGSSLDGLVKGVPRSDTTDHVRQLTTGGGPKTRDMDGLDEKQLGYQGGSTFEDEHTEKAAFKDAQSLKFEDTLPSLDTQKCSIDKGALSASATAYSPSTVQGTKDSKTSFSDTAGCDKVSAANQLENPQLRPSSSTSSSSEKLVETSTSSGLNLPPSSSVGFLASEKSTLNPHAKEFKLNPNAKSFVPSSSVRPHAPVADSSFYYPHNPTLSQMHGLPMGVSSTVGPSLPWRTKLKLFLFSILFNAARRSNGTLNRRLLSLVDLKARPNRRPVRGVRTADVTIDPSRGLSIRLFLPVSKDGAGGTALPVVVFFHGGGFTFLSAAFLPYDAVCRRFCRKLSVAVVSVDYRLSPEHRYPAQYDDGLDVLHFLESKGDVPGGSLLREFFDDADLSNCFLAGDSAGANIAHHVARQWSAGERPSQGRIRLSGLVAIQPFFGGDERVDSEIRFPHGPGLTLDQADWFWKAFLPDGATRDHEAANPEAAAADLGESFPPVIVMVGEFDPLLDWQLKYFQSLRSRGKKAEIIEYAGAIHGFYVLPELKSSAVLIEDLRSFIHRETCHRRKNGGAVDAAAQ